MPIRTLIVDDDFMIARVHAKFISRQAGYLVVGEAHSGGEALRMARDTRPDLIVLDIYLPDMPGLEVLAQLRGGGAGGDVILITAAKETDIVEQSFRLGVFDYLVKPFDLDRLSVSLRKYSEYRRRLTGASELDQRRIDDLQKLRWPAAGLKAAAESGIDPRTLERIAQCVEAAAEPQTIADIAAKVGVSRSTAKTYLDFLVERGDVVEDLQYGAVGRPRRLFRKA
ncbi:response regulator [Alicyclobacillus sp.]|uniref:response regulator n=1 Tax=Alicyclobacillus sp. TaxID=61169 RepID=UPI0025B7F1FD|nr:response regulator [Alicyclobacillus sp.]MCL6516487.1 response regulator [Alicyclobacillus sp.]